MEHSISSKGQRPILAVHVVHTTPVLLIAEQYCSRWLLGVALGFLGSFLLL